VIEVDRDKLSLFAENFKALAHPVRLEILLEVMDDCYDLKKIMKNFNMSQPAVSQHIGKMRRLGILSSYKEGANMCYKIIDSDVLKILEILKK